MKRASSYNNSKNLFAYFYGTQPYLVKEGREGGKEKWREGEGGRERGRKRGREGGREGGMAGKNEGVI